MLAWDFADGELTVVSDQLFKVTEALWKSIPDKYIVFVVEKEDVTPKYSYPSYATSTHKA